LTAAGRPEAGACQPFPWDVVQAFGFGVLRLGPDAFWRLTPREIAAAARALGIGRTAAPGRADLDALMRAFPDTSTTEGASVS
jgi:uncharacterized phage protein (TIGR02216 family)